MASLAGQTGSSSTAFSRTSSSSPWLSMTSTMNRTPSASSSGVDYGNGMEAGSQYSAYPYQGNGRHPPPAQPFFTHASGVSPWSNMAAAPSGTPSKEPLLPHLGIATSPAWTQGYGIPFYPHSQPGDNAPSSLPSHAYVPAYGVEGNEPGFGGPQFGVPSVTDTLGGSEAGNFLLGQYDLSIIGDDSGSGGMTRPRPKKRRRSPKASGGGSERHQQRRTSAANVENSQPFFDQGGHLVDFSPVPGDGSVAGATLFEEEGGTDNAGEDRDMGDVVDFAAHEAGATGSPAGYNEATELGALHQDLEGTEDEPLYVNPKQYNRILKRREVRTRMEEKRRRTEEAIRTGRLDVNKLANGRELAARVGAILDNGDDGSVDDGTGQRTYQHESRHKHAMRRPRGPGGRFLTAEEIKAKDAAEQEQEQAQAQARAQAQAQAQAKTDVVSKEEDSATAGQQKLGGMEGEAGDGLENRIARTGVGEGDNKNTHRAGDGSDNNSDLGVSVSEASNTVGFGKKKRSDNDKNNGDDDDEAYDLLNLE